MAEVGTRHKFFHHPVVGEVRMVASSFNLVTAPETRLQVYMAEDDESRSRLDWVVAHPEAALCEHCQP